MKRILALTALGVGFIVLLAGCKTVQAPLPAWAPNSQIAVTGEAIASANAAVMHYENDVLAGFVPSPTLKTVMSDIQQALVIAQPLFDGWEAAVKTNPAAPEPASLPSQLTRISTDLSKLPSSAGN